MSEADVSGGEEALATLFTLAVMLVFSYGPALVYAVFLWKGIGGLA